MWGWSIEAQRVALAAAGADQSREYCDELAASKARLPARVQPEWLAERARLLQPTRRARGDTILVATLLALGVNEADLIASLGAALARRDTIQAVDSGFTIAPGAGAPELTAAVADWTRAKRDAQTKPGRGEGNRAAAAKARAATLAKLPAARPLWRDRSPKRLTTAQIAAQVGLSQKTLYAELGRRPPVRKGKSDD